MPALRSASQNKIKEEEEEKKPTVDLEEQAQWVMLTPDCFITSDTKLCEFRHPQNGVTCLFAFQQKKVYELNVHKETYCSWFINETVQKDGSIYMITPVDPLFLILPYFLTAAKLGQYTTVDTILHSTEHSLACSLLQDILTERSLLKICLLKRSDDLVVYKLSEDKLKDWLSRKVKRLALHLQNCDINTGSGGQSVTFQRNSSGNKNEDDCMRYAWMMVSDYLQTDWSLKLKELLNIKDPIKEHKKEVSNVQPPAKRQKTDMSCIEDYRDATSISNKNQPKKLTSRQKSLLKVDKKGMKTMSNFFSKTPKK